MDEIEFIFFVIICFVIFVIWAGIFIIGPGMEEDLSKCENLSIQMGADLFEMDYGGTDDTKACILSFCENVSVNNESFLGKCRTEEWRFDSNGQSTKLPADKGE